MNVNITFFIQVINFFVTYKLLQKFLFKPLISSIEARKQRDTKLQQKIMQQEKDLVDMEKTKHAAVTSFQSRIKIDYPFTDSSERLQPKEIEIKPDLSGIDKEELIKKASEWIVKKVSHVC